MMNELALYIVRLTPTAWLGDSASYKVTKEPEDAEPFVNQKVALETSQIFSGEVIQLQLGRVVQDSDTDK